MARRCRPDGTKGLVSRLRTPVIDRRQQSLVLAAALTGALTGLAVTAIERIANAAMFERLLRLPLWVQAGAPLVGLALAAASLRWLAGGADNSLTDEYIRNFHDRHRRLDLRPVLGRLVASLFTLGFGGAMGFEGPSIYAGAAIGSGLQHRLSKYFRRDDLKALLVAGAAGGVAAIFKAPATGLLFALEAPYQDDVARRGLIPALVASATSYLVYASIIGTKPLFPLASGSTHFRYQELIAALVLGVLAGLGARFFSAFLRWSKDVSHRLPLAPRLGVVGVSLAGLVLISHHVYGVSLSLGPGYHTFDWVAVTNRGLLLIAGLFVIRFVATGLTLGGGGAGGLFFPLVVQGALLGRFVGGAYNGLGLAPAGQAATVVSLFTVLGVAAFLGAGYRAPLTGVMFVAESTGKAVFVVPALLAAAVAQLLMGRSSVSPVQRSLRAGLLERRFALPLSSVLSTNVLTVPTDCTLAEFMWVHVVGTRVRAVAVVDGERYLGMCRLEDVSKVPRADWDDTTVAEVMRTDLPTGKPEWTLRDAVETMEKADVDRLAVTAPDGTFIGVVRSSEIFKLDAILDDTGG